MIQDPMAESMNSWSPYSFTFNNPIRFNDPTGMVPDNYGIDGGGNITLLEETNDDYDVLYAVDSDGNKQDTDGSGGVSKADGVTVSDKSILPGLSKTEDVAIDGRPG